jgi:uncharacterized protein YwqG
MNYKLNVELSSKLEEFREKIEATIKPYIEITLENNEEPTWWQSKFGGLPYLPKGFAYPTTPEGNYLFLLAQINFAEVPHLENFPQKGILQFYVANEELYGLNYENHANQTGFRVLYFPEPDLNVENIVTNYEFLPEISQYGLPLSGCCSLQFMPKYAPISYNDFQFTELLGDDIYNLLAEDDRIFDEYTVLLSPAGHKIGGYPDFTQTDMRYFYNANQQEPYILLFQMDTDANDAIDIMWGDAGIGNFFIQESALKNLDFSSVLYNWDCG